jgi:hypothetical protein
MLMSRVFMRTGKAESGLIWWQMEHVFVSGDLVRGLLLGMEVNAPLKY